ncbi:energy coupling factor transporter S component ThiW [Fundicoccus culcitae]|uniref:Energy coupling factor transporter S component ThiW n=1 Tax=Fundicoccus culcitae TaxID=2969821 RepID=A0ABY5P7S0_9LACT|nr:energy coupling factor transporter S component ThiW [Fundicoccus culcitae]UUX34778.1 energy coupling factor transporter S component ThiW [Fundicoccus culcitae]
MKTRKMTLLALFVAMSFVLSTILVFPNMAPAQHMMNVIGAVLLGPWYNALAAFLSGGLRMLLSGRTFIATSGWVGALLAGFVYKRTKNYLLTTLAEIFGSGILSAVIYYFPMEFILGLDLPHAFYYIPFFLPSAILGAIAGYFAVKVLSRWSVFRIDQS